MQRRHVLGRLIAATTGWLSSERGSATLAVQGTRPTDRTLSRDDQFVVTAFGAVGDGVADDTAAIQAAITAASSHGVRVRDSGGTDAYTDADRLGGVVYFAAGRYMISRPLVMPRSGAYTAHTITMLGANPYSTTVAALPRFPAGRGLIEWEPVAKRVTGQRILSLGLDANNTSALCIWFQPTNKSDWAHIDAESMYGIHLRDLVLYGNNTTTRVLIKIEGRMDYSRIERVIADCVRGSAPVHSTVVLQFDSDLLGAPPWARLLDYPGFNFGTIDDVRQGMQGGYNTMIDGRLSHSTVSHVHHGVGALNSAPGVHLRNGGLLTLVEWDFEGNAEDPELWIDNCTEVAALHIQVSPTERGPGCGIRVTNSSFVRITGRAAITGYASFSQFGGRLLSIDEHSEHCRFEAIGGQTPFDKEIEWRSPGNKGNYIEYFEVPSGNVRTVRDENAAGQPSLRVTTTLQAVTIGPRSTETQTVAVPGAKPGAEILIGRRPAERGELPPAITFAGYVEQLNAVSVMLSNPTDTAVSVPTGHAVSIRVFNP